MRDRHAVIGSCLLLMTGCSISGDHRIEQIGCHQHENPRTADICRAIAREMEFKFMGHAVPAPGYKVTTGTLVRVYCQLKLTRDDAPALKQLRGVGPASDNLLQLIGAVPAASNSILHPEHPSYVLKDGCPPR